MGSLAEQGLAGGVTLHTTSRPKEMGIAQIDDLLVLPVGHSWHLNSLYPPTEHMFWFSRFHFPLSSDLFGIISWSVTGIASASDALWHHPALGSAFWYSPVGKSRDFIPTLLAAFWTPLVSVLSTSVVRIEIWILYDLDR